MQGTIEKIIPKEGKKGKFYAVCIDEDWYTTFINMSGFSEGQKVECEFEQRKFNGRDYKNITKIKPLDNGEQRRNDIVNSVALKAAVQLVGAVTLSPKEQTPEKALEIADKFKD